MFLSSKILLRTALCLTLVAPVPVLAAEQPANPPKEMSAEAALDGVALQGNVLETMNSNGYTYLLLDAAQGKIWVAIPETQVKVGQSLAIAPGMTMFNFTSKTLNRTFDRIVFAPGPDKGSRPAAAAEAAKPAQGGGFDAALRAEAAGAKDAAAPAEGGSDASLGTSTGSAGAVVPSSEVNVHKAAGPNSYSVGECFEQGKELNGKTVRVRGKVMKISRMIMGKNWLHIQDGTGNPLKNHHDLVVTTQEDPGEGTVVTIEGKLAADKDFGAGYRYDVLVEDAKIEK
ncbi:DNA-binding protein [Desulfobulbus sp.]|uniref:DNA-binding protein n=1 Tax=Desulfobulbus sp. TaxID=895 RepID=UPI00286F1C49|nr:DNA-binding protein [Desulfobulbus sp.]